MAAYGDKKYWDERFKNDPEPFDWFQNYSGVKEIISRHVDKGVRIINLGCGSSKLSEEMYDDGYENIQNVDISSVVVDQMIEATKSKPGLVWKEMDVMDMSAYEPGTFDVAMDKGTLDSILCGENSTANSQKMLNEVSRILKPDGLYMMISFGLEEHRMDILRPPSNPDAYGWKITVQKVPKPTVSGTVPALIANEADGGEASGFHYVYLCEKKAVDDEAPGSG